MSADQDWLAELLADLDPADIKTLRETKLAEREQVRKDERRLDDPHGTVRYDSEADIFMVCRVEEEDGEVYRSWDAYVRERHESFGDEDIDTGDCPILGQVQTKPEGDD